MASKSVKGFLLYRIYFRRQNGGEFLAYIGRTKQPLGTRIRGHLFAKPMHRSIHIEQVSKIEYAQLPTEADMNLYEIYYILKEKPPINVDDKARDSLTVVLPELEWQRYDPPLWDKWKDELEVLDRGWNEKSRRLHRDIPQELSILRSRWRMGELTEEDYYAQKDALQAEADRLRERLYPY